MPSLAGVPSSVYVACLLNSLHAAANIFTIACVPALAVCLNGICEGLLVISSIVISSRHEIKKHEEFSMCLVVFVVEMLRRWL